MSAVPVIASHTTPSSSPWEEGENSSALDPRILIAVFLRRARAFGIVFVLIFGLVLLWATHQQRLYGATASLLVEPSQADALKSSDPGYHPTDIGLVDTDVQILNSQSLAGAVVDKLGLYTDSEFNKAKIEDAGHSAVGATPSATGALSAPVDSTLRDQVIDKLLTRVTARRVGLTSIITITAVSSNPHKAALLANAFADAYVKTNLDVKTSGTRSINRYLTEQIAELQAQVQAADSAVQRYKIDHNLLSAEGATMAEQEASSINQQLAIASADVAEKTARLRAAQSQMSQGGDGGDVGAALSSDTIKSLRAQEALASQKLADLSTRYGPRYPDVQKTESELRAIRQQIQAEIARIMSSLQAEVQVANQRVQSLRASESGAHGSLASNNQAQVGLMQLQSKADAARAIYESVLNRSKETSAQEGIQQADARVVSVAQPSNTPVSPKLALASAFGAACALLAGLATILILELFDTSLRTSDDVESKLGIAYAGGVPIPSSTGKISAADRQLSPEAYLLKYPFSSFAESFRSIRTYLLLRNEGETPIKIIALTSALPKEGKSVTSFCLMRTSAQAGLKVLLVDGDLRRRGVTQLLPEAATVGLIEVLEGQATLTEALVLDEATGGWILPVCATPSSTKDYLSSPQMDELLKVLRQQFDLVIFDTPPVLALADARTIASKVDRTLMLAHWARTPQRAIDASLALLVESGATVSGLSLTRIDMERQGMQGYGDQAYYYKSYRSYYANS